MDEKRKIRAESRSMMKLTTRLQRLQTPSKTMTLSGGGWSIPSGRPGAAHSFSRVTSSRIAG